MPSRAAPLLPQLLQTLESILLLAVLTVISIGSSYGFLTWLAIAILLTTPFAVAIAVRLWYFDALRTYERRAKAASERAAGLGGTDERLVWA